MEEIRITTERGDELVLTPCYDCDRSCSFYDVHGVDGRYWGELHGDFPDYDPEDEDSDSVIEEIKEALEEAIDEGILEEQPRGTNPYNQTVYVAVYLQVTPFDTTAGCEPFASKEGAKAYMEDTIEEFLKENRITKDKAEIKDDGLTVTVATEDNAWKMQICVRLKDVKP